MARLCNNCRAVHPPEESCADAAVRINKRSAEITKTVDLHRKGCRGCPDPYQHVMNLESLDNPIPWQERRLR